MTKSNKKSYIIYFMKILLIEDDLILGESVKEYLELNDIEVVWIYDDRQFKDVLKFNQFDVMVIDLMLRYNKGEDIIEWIRDNNINTPILVLTAKNSIESKEECFNKGADDYLVKPFEPKELLLRLKALSKRKKIEQLIKIGDILVDLDNKIIKKQNEEIKISKTAWKILYLLISRRGEIVDTETILNYVWGDKAVGDEIVRAYIKELRKILPPDSIQTYKGRGYRLV
ncbi:DNA-binding response regulator, OmpR family, contains REC and winged-helix (wHTH) domain [Venenivibrio stagnispumantis]|uniref:DNA-binding response regulator, OmpR family, contains REC and winged-helix (WHTH) domain n=2 Tax=Venenivibrio stagnispumantis TaxID=407998 RepID=A0AA46AE77_9AQUI|nr:DNA-binding response regulator, OmpR family, contains REC and winged-helix (wHTH) domain [Venenivibrio stagnispumantis]